MSTVCVDNNFVTLLSAIDCANEFVEVQRKVKANQKWEKFTVKKTPMSLRDTMHI